MQPAATLDRLVHQLEHATALDKPASMVVAILNRVLPKGRVQELASGTPLGHPLHPALVAIPIGAWTSATYFDLTGGDARTARRLIGLGNLAALPAALTGANDFMSTEGAERRVGLVHAVLNDVALGLYAASWLARRRGRRVRGAALSMAGAAVLSGAGYLGGHLAYARGVGVDTTAFQELPEQWTSVAVDSIPEGGMVATTVNGVSVLLARRDGQLVALANRCTHRGGPLDEGSISDGSVVCPWHGSRFRLTDGCVLAGPATRPQPVLEVRDLDGEIQIRLPDEAGASDQPCRQLGHIFADLRSDLRIRRGTRLVAIYEAHVDLTSPKRAC
jgi:nitrite reductase/ring-hydroxylating ferredoxin subunit/uncharacterized membrane protein